MASSVVARLTAILDVRKSTPPAAISRAPSQMPFSHLWVGRIKNNDQIEVAYRRNPDVKRMPHKPLEDMLQSEWNNRLHEG